MAKISKKKLFKRIRACLILLVLIIGIVGIVKKVRKPANTNTSANTKAVTQQSQSNTNADQTGDSNNSSSKDQQNAQSQDDKSTDETSNQNNSNTESQQVNQTGKSDAQESKNNASEKSSKDTVSDNTIVYYVPGHKIYHLNKNDASLKGYKDIKTMTLKEAKEKGMKIYDPNSKI